MNVLQHNRGNKQSENTSSDSLGELKITIDQKPNLWMKFFEILFFNKAKKKEKKSGKKLKKSFWMNIESYKMWNVSRVWAFIRQRAEKRLVRTEWDE